MSSGETRLMVKGTAMAGYERLYKQNKQKHKIRQKKTTTTNAVKSPLYSYVYLSDHKFSDDMSLKIPQNAKLSIYHEIFDRKDICSNSVVTLIDTEIILKSNHYHVLFLFFPPSHA